MLKRHLHLLSFLLFISYHHQVTADCSIEDNTEGKFECYDIFGDPLDHEEAQEIPDWGYCQRHCGRFHFSQPLYSVCQGDTESWSVPLDTLQCVDSTSIVTVVRNQIQVVAKDLAEACILDTNLPADYKGHSLNAYNNVLYLCGGHRYYGKECRKFDLTNPDQGWVNLRKMDESLEGHSSVIANGKLFIIGGRKTDGRYSNQIYTLDLNDENARWQPHRLIGPDGSYSSYGACAVYLEEKIYLIGGVLGDPSKILEVSTEPDPEGNVAARNSSKLQVGRMEHACVALPADQAIYISGGREHLGSQGIWTLCTFSLY